MSHSINTLGSVEPAFFNSRSFVESAKQLASSDGEAWAGIVATRHYLREFRRAAVAPDVQWHIVQSAFGEHCGELRWPNPEDQAAYPGKAIRGLFVAHPSDEWYVFTLLGNKASGRHRGGDWYDLAVAESDRIAYQAIKALDLTPFPPE